MKKWILCTIIVVYSLLLHAQSVGINNSGAAPDSSAMLDIRSLSKGLLIPRLTSAERMAVANPANGLTVFDRETKGYWYYLDGEGWIEMVSAKTNYWDSLNMSIINKYQLPVSISDLPGGSEADPSSLLHINSNSKGVLIPRLTTAERIAVPAPANGLTVYDRSTSSFCLVLK